MLLTVSLSFVAGCRCIVTSLADHNTLLFDHLLSLKPVKFLEGELIHDVSLETGHYSYTVPYF